MGEIRKFNRIDEIICNETFISSLPTIQTRLTKKRLQFCCDSVNYEDWLPILCAISTDPSLVEIHVYSKIKRKKIAENVDTEEKLEKYRIRSKKGNFRGPIIYTNFLLKCFIDAVAVCSKDSKFLTTLNLDGIPLSSGKYFNILCTGLSFNRNIRNISLARCKIGDSGCEVLLRALLDNPNIRSIDLTSCFLTSKSSQFIVLFLKKKRTKLLQQLWHETSKNDDGNSNQGLNTLILNKNGKFGDDGLRTLFDTLKDDFWLKSLSLCHCGLTKKSGEFIIDLLEINSTLARINFKENKLPIALLRTIKRLLKRRMERGERISLRRRLVNRKKIFQTNRNNSSIGKKVMNQRTTRNRPIIRNINIVESKKVKESNLKELKDRLSYLIDCNRKLKRVLSNDRRLLVGEKRLRIDAEKSYQLMTPMVEKLSHGFQKQNRICSRVLFESYLCNDIRKIFKDLENISVLDPRILNPENSTGIIQNGDLIVEKLSLDHFGNKNKKYPGAPKRPNCPPR